VYQFLDSFAKIELIFVDIQGGDFPQTLEDAGELHKS